MPLSPHRTIINFDQLLAEAKALGPVPTAVVAAAEQHVIEAALHAAQEGMIEPVLIGRRADIEPLCQSLACQFTILEADTVEHAAMLGVQEVKQGRAKLLIKGNLHTAEFLHPIVKELHGEGRISHIFIAELSTYPKLLMLTDAAINIAPDLMTKAAILRNAIELAHALGNPVPKVAVLSAIEDVSVAMASTLDAAALAKMADRGQFPAAVVDGPLAFDNAISAEAASIKGIRSPVAGQADILLMPELVSGNILYKALEYLANARFAGIVLGASVPVVLTSRTDSTQTKLDSIALARVAHARMMAIGH